MVKQKSLPFKAGLGGVQFYLCCSIIIEIKEVLNSKVMNISRW